MWRAILILVPLASLACASSRPSGKVAAICQGEDCTPAKPVGRPPVADGVQGRVEGGVERPASAGVAGGRPGGIPDPDEPPGARKVPANIGVGQRLADLREPKYKPYVRAEFNVPGANYWALFKVCVSDQGEVQSVRTLRGTGAPAIDEDWSRTIKRWPYRPYSVNGRPVPFCHPLRLEMRIR